MACDSDANELNPESQARKGNLFNPAFPYHILFIGLQNIFFLYAIRQLVLFQQPIEVTPAFADFYRRSCFIPVTFHQSHSQFFRS